VPPQPRPPAHADAQREGVAPRRHIETGRHRPAQIGPAAHDPDRTHPPGQQPCGGAEHRSDAVTNTDVESRCGSRRQHPVVDTQSNRTLREQRGADVTGREDRHDPACPKASFQHHGDEAENEDRQRAIDDAVDPKRAGDEHEDRMRRQLFDVGTRDRQDRVVMASVEQTEHDAAGPKQGHVDECERSGTPGRQERHHRNLPGVARDLFGNSLPCAAGNKLNNRRPSAAHSQVFACLFSYRRPRTVASRSARNASISACAHGGNGEPTAHDSSRSANSGLRARPGPCK